MSSPVSVLPWWSLAFGDTEVDNLYLARPRDEQVGRVDVAMNQIERLTAVVGGSVRIGEPLGGLRNELAGDRRGQRAALRLTTLQQDLKIDPADKLHLQIELITDPSGVVNLDDPIVMEPRRQLRSAKNISKKSARSARWLSMRLTTT